MEKVKENIPSWALTYLLYDDCSGITEEDKKVVDEWIDSYDTAIIVCPLDDCEEYFTRYPAFGEPCDVIDCDVLYNV